MSKELLNKALTLNSGRLADYQVNPVSGSGVEVLAEPDTAWARRVDQIETPFAPVYDYEEYELNAALAFMGINELEFLLNQLGVRRIDFKSQPLAGKKILDVGTGPGRVPVLLSALGASVTGFDATREYVAIAQAKIATAETYLGRRLDVRLFQCPAERFDYPAKEYDGVTALFGVLNHIELWQETVGNIARALKPKGTFVGSMYGPNEALVFRLLRENALVYKPSILQRRTGDGILLGDSYEVLPASFPSPGEISRTMEAAGLRITRQFGSLRLAALFPQDPSDANLRSFLEIVQQIEPQALRQLETKRQPEDLLLSAMRYDQNSQAPIEDFAYVAFSAKKG